jgi:hypothetical protein
MGMNGRREGKEESPLSKHITFTVSHMAIVSRDYVLRDNFPPASETFFLPSIDM